MIVHGDGQGLFRVFLADAMQIELTLDFRRFRNMKFRRLLSAFGAQFLVENIFADDDTVVADVNTRPLNELLHLGVRLAAETAQR